MGCMGTSMGKVVGTLLGRAWSLWRKLFWKS